MPTMFCLSVLPCKHCLMFCLLWSAHLTIVLLVSFSFCTVAHGRWSGSVQVPLHVEPFGIQKRGLDLQVVHLHVIFLLSECALLAVALLGVAAADYVLTCSWYAGTRMLRQLLPNLRCRPRCSVLSRFWRPSRRGEPPVLLTTLQDQAATNCLNCLLSCRLCSRHVHAVYFLHVLLLHIHMACRLPCCDCRADALFGMLIVMLCCLCWQWLLQVLSASSCPFL